MGRNAIGPAMLVATRVREDQLGVQAGSLTYGAFLSIPPILMLIVSIAGLVYANNAAAQQNLLNEVTRLVPGLDGMVRTQLDLQPVGQVSGGVFALAVVLWAASGWAARARHALGVVFRTENTGLVSGRVYALATGLPILILLLALIAASVTVSSLDALGTHEILSATVVGLLALASAFVLFLLAYGVLTPGSGPRVREHLPGTVVMAVAFVLLEILGTYYVTAVIAKSTALYGTIGAAFGVLAFLYLLMYLFLVSAELSQAWRERPPV